MTTGGEPMQGTALVAPEPDALAIVHDPPQSMAMDSKSSILTLQLDALPPLRQYSGPVRLQFAQALQDHFESNSEVNTPPLQRCHPGSPRFRGVTKHKRTQRYEAHIWESKKQIYLGGFDSEVLAAKSHDIMALRCKGPDCDILNFEKSHYTTLLPLLECLSREDIITALRNYSKSQTAQRLGTNGSAASSFGMRSGAAVHHRVQHSGAAYYTNPHSRHRQGDITLPSPLSLLDVKQHSMYSRPWPGRRRRRPASLDISSSSDDDDDDNVDGIDGNMYVEEEKCSDGDAVYIPPRRHLHRNLDRGGGDNRDGSKQQRLLPLTNTVHATTHPNTNTTPATTVGTSRRSGRCPGSINLKQSSSISKHNENHQYPSLRPLFPPTPTTTITTGTGAAAAADLLGGSAPSSPHTPPAQCRAPPIIRASSSMPRTGDDDVQQPNQNGGWSFLSGNGLSSHQAALYDSIDLNTVLSQLDEEPSLTYSANDDAYLFESMPLNGAVAAGVEHVAGGALLQHSMSLASPSLH